jgi:hypothetical protein
MFNQIELGPVPPGASATTLNGVPVYRFVLSEIDQLIKVLFGESVNPQFFINSLNADGRADIIREPRALVL